MKNLRIFFIFLVPILGAIAIYLMLQSEKALVTHPKGVIAESMLTLIKTNILLMLSIIVPTFIFLFYTVFRATRSNNENKKSIRAPSQAILWILPSIVVVVMAVITFEATHRLDPYKPLISEVEPITIQVMALDWKWLFIYPAEEIASVNYVNFPVKTPIRFELSADRSPMNSFWIPELGGQIYAMTGMITPLHIMANQIGEFSGKAAEINGKGYAGMRFVAKASTKEDFQAWVQKAKESPLVLNPESYKALAKPSRHDSISFYSHVDKNLFDKMVHKYMFNPH